MLRWGLLGLALAMPALAQQAAPTALNPAPPSVAPPTQARPGRSTAPADRAARVAAERKAEMDRILDALKTAGNEQEAAALERQIRQMWLNAGTPAVTLLLGRGVRELSAGSAPEAIQDLEAALALDPDSVEAWHHLAMARFSGGDTRGAISAIGETLKREPRHFAALQSLSRFAESREDWKGAYEAWSKAMEIAPKLEGGEAKLKDLRRRAFGDET